MDAHVSAPKMYESHFKVDEIARNFLFDVLSLPRIGIQSAAESAIASQSRSKYLIQYRELRILRVILSHWLRLHAK